MLLASLDPQMLVQCLTQVGFQKKKIESITKTNHEGQN